MFFKKLISKNLIPFFAALVVIVALVVPEILVQEKQTPNKSAETKTSDNKVSVETKNQEPQVFLDQPAAQTQNQNQQQVQGSTSQKPAPSSSQNQTTQKPPEIPPTPVAKTVTLNIETGQSSYSYKVDFEGNESVWDILKKASDQNSFSLKANWYGGSFNSYYVTEIHGKNCECWEYKVNGTKPSFGASVVKAKENDTITWQAK